MGGKNKQRTKGNVRPSSSGRAADLLARESGIVPGFVGFGVSTSSDPGYVPAVQGAEEIDNLVDADFRMVLRKLSKRDAVTKLKAVQEFGAMCQEREPDVVKGVLPYWPRIYCRISVDHDRRVREATQLAFEQLVLKVKRNLAPYLKSIMGHWLISQCDTYSPAASAASSAFQAAFPLNKQAEAISFCKDEVVNVLQDNLLKETADTLSDPQSVPEEEREAKYIRLLTCSLLALKRLLSVLPEQDRELLKERLTQLLAQGKFWKYSKHKTPQIRGAFFELIATMCAHTPQLIQAEAARACSSVLLSIDDTDPVVLPPLWEAVLHILSCVDNCWAHVNARKGVMPKLWVLLKEGGRGLATSLHPNLLPFISKLPAEITQPNLEFSRAFLTSVIEGLSSDRATSSPSESAAIIFATMECLRFIILQNAGDEQEQRNIQNMLISEQLLPLIDRALGHPSLQTGPLFPQVSDMLLSWEKRVAGKEAPTFQRLLSDFWEGLGRLCTAYVDCEEAKQTALEGIASLLQIMHNPNSASKKAKKKKTVKICFTDMEERGQGEEPPREAPAVEEQHCPLRNGHLLDLVCQLAELNMVYVSERESERHLRFLSQLLGVFPSPQVFQVLLRPEEMKPEMGPELRPLAENAAVHFLLQRVTVWLKQDNRKDTDFLVDMVFSSLQCCSSSDDKTLILNHISRDLNWSVTLQLIEKACSDPVRLEVCVGWLRGPVLGERLVGLAGELCVMGLRGSPSSSSHHHVHGWPLISLALSQQHNNAPLIGKAYVKQIIDKLHATLSEAKGMSDAGNIEPLVTFISDVAATFFSSVKGCLLLASAEDLLMTVFQLCAQDQISAHLSDALLLKLQQAYTAGVQSLITHLGAGFTKGTLLHNIALWVKSQLLTMPLTVKSLQVLVQAVESLAQTIASAQNTSCLLSQFICCLTPTEEEWSCIRRALPPQWVKRPLLCGRLRVTGEYPCMGFFSTNQLPAHLCVSALLGRIIFTAASPDDQQVEADFSEIPDLKHIVSEIFYGLQWCEEMELSPSLVSEYHKLLQSWNLEQRIHSNSLIQTTLSHTLFTRSQEEGSLWSLALAKYMQNSKMEPSHIKNLYGNVESFFPLSEHSVSTVQVLCPFLASEERESLIALCVAELLNWQDGEQDCIDSVRGCLAVLLCCLQANTAVEDEILLAVVATIAEWRNSREEWFLFSRDLGKVSAAGLLLAVEMIRFLCWMVDHSPTVLGNTHWDLLLCSMLAWLETASENSSMFWNPWVQLFVCANCELIVRLSEFFTSPPAGVEEQLPPELNSEWKEFFLEGIHNLLLPLLIKIPVEFTEPDDPLFPLPALRAVGEALTYIPVELLTQNKLPPRFVADQRSSLPEPLQTLLNTLSPLLLFKARPLQLAVYHILHKVMPSLPESDSESVSTKSDDEDGEEPCLSPPAALMSILSATEELLENILGGMQVGEFAVVQPLSMEHCFILGYLLAWKLLFTFFKASSSHLRAQYSLHLKKTRSLHKLLLHLFRLMPENPSLPGQPAEPSNKEPKTFFTESLSLSPQKTEGLQFEVPHLACSVYYGALKDLPAMVRLWWNSQEKRVFSTVDKFTSKYVSSVLSAQEIASVQSSTQTFENMTVKARSAAREVIATYSVDDIFIELVIQLPQNYPLSSISVESGRRVGVAVQQWRNWMLQLSTYLTHQNGSILEGLSLWKNNVDKRFEGVEDCMICFSVIHGSNYSLPKKACRTCKKKFHSACLYKWFTSSNKSTCPLCRETFF
ncbi:E3 ubiquitin-protein ligase listerin [Puntigrus tetrazona]|uniref:E3 ubiquitin-protein ligase listerin n=1 Tax=Puntigrus tetrazona TaxID=1606681 RepID=UPI001C8B03A7|nr:E3 ubiquitin-protein ligase listerin [Puntigrus tetrazona]XP_043106095.1 E3 ubiquitin-protein ligase listerin [Puntigrus tetrazona]XP_043106096.1 E3 ubiquitin-protein ligase listerin [Puntigrus tetrazona]